MTKTKFRSGVFISYSHVDLSWLKRLRTHLTPYLRGEVLDIWDDTRIAPGSKWAAEIKAAIRKARVAVLLVSPDFLASKYVVEVELPEILRRSPGDMTILWIPIRPSAFDSTPLATFQAAHDPSRPLAALSKAKQDKALVEISKKIVAAVDISAVANAFRIIDDFEPQVNAFSSGLPEPKAPKKHSVYAEQVEATIHLVDHGKRQELITAKDMENLDDEDQKLIRAYERTMKDLFDRWVELKPKRYSRDRAIRGDARKESDEIKNDLCDELNGLLGFIESMGKSLHDHYNNVRYICSRP
jgi:TIR domain